jgi:RNase P/RNase MRP subunit p29
MKKLLFMVALGCFSVMGIEINKESVKKEAIAQIGEFQIPENGSKVELELRDSTKIKGSLSKVTADKIYLEVEDGAINVYKPEQLAPGFRWKFFKAEYDKKLKTVIDEIIEDKKVEAAVKEKKAAALALKVSEKKETEKKTDTPKVEEKKSVESIKKEFGEFKAPTKDSVFELELTDGTQMSGKVSKVSGNKVYLEIEEGRVSVHKRDKILPNSRWKLFKEDFDKKLKDTIDEFKAEEAKKAPPAPPVSPVSAPVVAPAQPVAPPPVSSASGGMPVPPSATPKKS